MDRAQNNHKVKELFNHQAFIKIVHWAIGRWTELEEAINTSEKSVDRLKASDKKQIIQEFLNILEDEMEDDND